MTFRFLKASGTLVAFVALFFFALAIPRASLAEDVTCECQDSSCGPCEIEVGTSFYSAKCGAGNSRVKSCKKPTCQAVDNQKQCFALLNAPKENSTKVVEKKSEGEAPRAPASVGQPAGKVDNVAGTVQIERAKGGTEIAKKDMTVYVGDTLVTNDGKIQVALEDGSMMMVPRDSKLKIENVAVVAEKKRNIVLNLLKGKVRSQVNKNYKDENVFQVRTRTAVAGVRGTDFMASVELTNEQWITAVKTIEGKVRLNAVGSDGEADEHRIVTEGTAAAFVVKAPSREPASESEFKKIVSGGELSPISYISEDELRLIKDATEFKPVEVQASVGTRQVASLDSDSVCSEPIGQFNQCSFTCEGNPSGEKKCRTDLPAVKCVRRLCRANGLWVEPKRLPASQADLCEPVKSIVRDCGSYW
ncbi:MAG: FecR family protein [Bdellovibrionota bacterium]